MKRNFTLFLLLGLTAVGKTNSFRGAEMYATNITGHTYQFDITVYFKASSASSLDYVALEMGDGSYDTLSTTSGYIDSLSNLKICHYTFIHTYSADGLYEINVSVRNWEAGVLNLVDAVNQTFIGTLMIDISPFIGPNHFGGFNSTMLDGVQTGNNYSIDLSWNDPDGDSVVIVQQTVSNAPVGIAYYFPSGFAGGMNGPEYLWENTYHLDSIVYSGNYAVSFRFDEYRNGTLIGSQLREFDFVYNDAIAGIKEKDHKTLMEIFPNPCNSQVCVRTMSPENFDVLDVNGKKVLSAVSNQSTDFSMLENGIYFIKTKSGSVCKLIKN